MQVLAKRSLGAVTVKYQINGGAVQTASTTEWGGGEKYDLGTSRYYHAVRGVVTGTNPGDSVKVWFAGGGQTSDSFTYQAVSESANDVLILAAEDYTGVSPVPRTRGPSTSASTWTRWPRTASGPTSTTSTPAGARRRRLGVLSHYDAVVWYTGDDAVTREPGWSAGNASRLAMDELLEVRAYLNEGGKVLYTGKYAGHQYTQGHGPQFYDPTEANARCTTPPAPTRGAA